MNTATEHLVHLGLSQNEAGCYIELLKDSPSNPYRVSKKAGIPTSKVYEVFSKLVDRGLVAEIDGPEKGYVPKDPDTAMAEWRSKYERETTAAAVALKTIAPRNTHQIVWNVEGRDDVIAQGTDLISSTKQTLSIAVSHEFEDAWSMAIKQAENRNVRIKLIAQGGDGRLFEGVHVKDPPPGGAVLAVDQSIAFFASADHENETLHGAWTENRAIVEMTEGFIENRIFIDMMIDNHWFRWGDRE